MAGRFVHHITPPNQRLALPCGTVPSLYNQGEMTSELWLRRKWTLRAHGEKVVFIKKRNERAAHVWMKAFLWALYLPQYPDLAIEISIGGRYKPDVVAMDALRGRPRFWGEAGRVGVEKIHKLTRRYRDTHFAMAKWDTPLAPYVEIVTEALADLRRDAPFDLLTFPPDSAERFIDARGVIRISREDLTWIRLDAEAAEV